MNKATLKVGRPLIQNSCKDTFELRLRVQLNHLSETASKDKLKLTIRACRSSWANSFCRGNISTWVTRKCRLGIRQENGTIGNDCRLTEDLLCKLQTSHFDWTMATYVIMMKGELGTVKLIIDPIYVTPLFYMQTCHGFKYLSVARPCQKILNT